MTVLLVTFPYLLVRVVQEGHDIKPHDVYPVGDHVHLRHPQEPKFSDPSCVKERHGIQTTVSSIDRCKKRYESVLFARSCMQETPQNAVRNDTPSPVFERCAAVKALGNSPMALTRQYNSHGSVACSGRQDVVLFRRHEQ